MKPRLRPEPIMWVCAECKGLTFKLPRGWADTTPGTVGYAVNNALEAARLELPCECEGDDDDR